MLIEHLSVIIVDSFLQGLEIVFRVGLAILQMNQTELIQLDMEGMLQVCHHKNDRGLSFKEK